MDKYAVQQETHGSCVVGEAKFSWPLQTTNWVPRTGFRRCWAPFSEMKRAVVEVGVAALLGGFYKNHHDSLVGALTSSLIEWKCIAMILTVDKDSCPSPH